MGTSATIEIKDSWGDKYYIYRGHDGFPETIFPDIQRVIDTLNKKWFKNPDASHVATVMIGELYQPKNSVPDYEITRGWHGDESYRYTFHYSSEMRGYVAGIFDA